jgi:hypothetical protein
MVTIRLSPGSNQEGPCGTGHDHRSLGYVRGVTLIAIGAADDHGAAHSLSQSGANVVVQGVISTDGRSIGALLLGNNIVFQNNMITHPVNAGEDTDGIRCFGDHVKMLRNRISDVSDGSRCTNEGCSGTGGPHPDCFQTFYSPSYPTSSDIVIDGNRCEKIVAQCLIAEGTNVPDEGIAGPGESANWTFSNNYCEDSAYQALMIKTSKMSQ